MDPHREVMVECPFCGHRFPFDCIECGVGDFVDDEACEECGEIMRIESSFHIYAYARKQKT